MSRSFNLDRAVPWGRNRAEYLAFFDLLQLAPGARVLDCGGGPSSFNAEMTALGFRVVSADPLYAHSKDAIKTRIAEARRAIMAGLRAAPERYVWRGHGSPEGLERTRLSSMTFFLDDYEAGRADGRYLAAALPRLPFRDGAFDLALSSHTLLTYSAQIGFEAHLAACLEMLRVAGEARIFPLLDLEGRTSRHLEPLRAALDEAGYASQTHKVGYEFQKGGDRMLRVAPG